MNKDEIIIKALNFALYNWTDFENYTNFKTYFEEVRKVLRYVEKKEDLELLKKELI